MLSTAASGFGVFGDMAFCKIKLSLRFYTCDGIIYKQCPVIQGEREHTGGIHMNWSIVANVILVILLILVVILAVLYFLGRKMEKRQVEQQSAIDAAKQTVSLMAIDKKKLKIKEAGLPPIVYEQTPWYAKRMKVPVVKAKIGTKIMTMIADEKVFLQLPLKTEIKVEISGLYITAIKSVPRGGLIPLPKKKTIGQRIKGIFKKD